ncbi:helix-turn-helix transcriptional regulator [Leeia oryzae]|uniref:helix-turn-helix transcriptional regulator n=1 Tax=Leeia oryzae TaxID=356662 RepID=UPI0003815B5E|nr:LuxR family transcriptional regulator [Leeia oryzae]
MLNLDDLAWHRAIGSVIDTLDQNEFWLRLTRLLADYVHFDSWVALRFSAHERPLVLAEIPLDDGLPDPLFEDYLSGLYMLDPFFIAARESRREGLIRLDDVAPDRFKSTEYYQRYFRLNIVEDEIQLNCLVDHDATLCLSLGSHRRFSPAELALLAVLSQWLIPLLRQRWRHELRQLAATATPVPPATSPSALANRDMLDFRLSGASLSARELEISRLMLSGFSSKGIAQRLGISAETVKVHRKHLYAKLGINSQSELFSLFLKDTTQRLER